MMSALSIQEFSEPTGLAQQTYQEREALYQGQPPWVQRFLEEQASALAGKLLQKARRASFCLPERVWRSGPIPGQVELLTIPKRFRRQRAGNLSAGLQQRLTELEEAEDPGLATGAKLVRHATALRLLSSFHAPEGTAFDEQGSLLASSTARAEAYLASMQRALAVLTTAIALAPYLTAGQHTRQKQEDLTGQLIHQGRALAAYQTGEIIDTIKRRAAANSLNRGLRLSLPYLDDKALEMRAHEFEVIPPGRIPFDPAYVMLAAREEQIRVSQDPQLSSTTRKHLLEGLKRLEKAFEVPGFSGFTFRLRKTGKYNVVFDSITARFCVPRL
jgi:hypothetical protein